MSTKPDAGMIESFVDRLVNAGSSNNVEAELRFVEDDYIEVRLHGEYVDVFGVIDELKRSDWKAKGMGVSIDGYDGLEDGLVITAHPEQSEWRE